LAPVEAPCLQLSASLWPDFSFNLHTGARESVSRDLRKARLTVRRWWRASPQ